MSTVASVFEHRLTASCNAVPLKYEHVVFCQASPLQVSLYDLFTSSPEIQTLLRGTGSQPLKAIDLLRKLCNTPQLLDLPSALHGSEKLLPEGFVGAGESAGAGGRGGRANATVGLSTKIAVRPEYSGKMAVLERYAVVSRRLTGTAANDSLARKIFTQNSTRAERKGCVDQQFHSNT